MKKQPKITIEEKEMMARDLIYQIWKSIPWDSVSGSRRMKIYDEYASKVKSAAHTNSLKLFMEKLMSKMGCPGVGGKKDGRERALQIVKEDDPEVLQLLREETQLIMLMLREKIELEKQQSGDLIDGHIDSLIGGEKDGIF